jgi:hypothetical protein
MVDEAAEGGRLAAAELTLVKKKKQESNAPLAFDVCTSFPNHQSRSAHGLGGNAMRNFCASERQRSCTKTPARMAYALFCPFARAGYRCYDREYSTWPPGHRAKHWAAYICVLEALACLCASRRAFANRIVEPVRQQRGSGAHHVDHGRNDQAHEACRWQADFSMRSGASLT